MFNFKLALSIFDSVNKERLKRTVVLIYSGPGHVVSNFVSPLRLQSLLNAFIDRLNLNGLAFIEKGL